MFQRAKVMTMVAVTAATFAVAVGGPAAAAPAGSADPELRTVRVVSGQPEAVGQTGPTVASTVAIERGTSLTVYIGNVRVDLSRPYQWLDVGRSWTFGRSRLTLQTDGNLVIYDNNNRARWASNTVGKGASQLLFQPDSNLVLYTPGYERAVWATGRFCESFEERFIGLQSDSNFVVYCGVWSGNQLAIRAIWATGTVY